MSAWTTEAVAALAPDASSLAAGRSLARSGGWSETGANELLVWGRCQGSGRDPYQVSVDLSGPAYRCSCPSRKIPCKHVLALLLRWAEAGGDLGSPDTAGFAQEWAEARADRAARRAERTERAATEPAAVEDAQAAERRLETRVRLMSAGVDDLSLWLADLVRGGLTTARRRPLSWWDQTAARLVDAQVPGLAERVRRIASVVNGSEDWVDALLLEVGRLRTAAEAWRHRDALDPAGTGDLRAVLGWAVPTDDVRAGERLTDVWCVLGAYRTDTGKVAEQRTWLRGEATGEVVRVLDFAAGGQPLPVARLAGARLRGELVRYPGAGVRRGLFVAEPEPDGALDALPDGGDLAGAAATRALALAGDPWTAQVPVLLSGVRLDARPDAPVDGRPAGVRVVDAAGRVLPVLASPDPWALVAVAGGAPVSLFGELEDGALRVLAASGVPGRTGVVGA